MSGANRVFISYRRDGGAEMARLIREGLQHRGFRVFMDVEDLRSGRFDVALLKEIDACTDVIVILSPGSMERCRNEGDWVRREVAHAISRGKNVVTVRTRGFKWPEEALPEEIKDLHYFQGVEPSHNLFEASVDKLVTLLKSRPSVWASRRVRAGVLAACAVVVLGVLCTAAVMRAGRGRQNGGIGQGPAPVTRVAEGWGATRVATTLDPNFTFARDLCFKQDQWTDGMALLAKLPGTLQAPAMAELRGPGRTGEMDLAREWMNAAQSAAVEEKWHCYRRARFWYRKAVDNALMSAEAKSAVREEMARVPALKASLRLRGESPFRERVVVKRTSITWFSEEGNSARVQLSGLQVLSPFSTGRGLPQSLGEKDARALFPEGVDFSTAKVRGAHFGGTTGSVSEILESRILPEASGFELKFGEKNAARVRYPGSFNFNIEIGFGE